MKKQGHILIGLGGGVVSIAYGLPIHALGFLLGSTAPDTLEMSYRKSGTPGDKPWHYGRIIPHRTITHWAPLWLALLALVHYSLPGYQYFHGLPLIGQVDIAFYVRHFLEGYIIGCLLHIVADWTTPMGVPFWHPFGKRYSLRLCKTPAAQYSVVFLFCMGCGLAVYPQLSPMIMEWLSWK